MSELKTFLAGKKTHLVVVALMLLNAFTDQNAGGVDLDTLRETLQLGLVSTVKSALDRWLAPSA